MVSKLGYHRHPGGNPHRSKSTRSSYAHRGRQHGRSRRRGYRRRSR